jgi:transposase
VPKARFAATRLIGERVEVIVTGTAGAGGQLRVRHGPHEVARHALIEGRRQRVIDPAHLAGLVGTPGRMAHRTVDVASYPASWKSAPPYGLRKTGETMPTAVDETQQSDVAQRFREPQGHEMVEPEQVAAMLRLKGQGWGTKRISAELGVNRGTVKRYLKAGGWQPFQPGKRKAKLDGLGDWLAERFRRHRGNADVVRQELAAEKGIVASIRTVERAVQPLRQALLAGAGVGAV